MAYCVNCGVELQKGEPRCPLCGVESRNPLEPAEGSGGVRPYPLHVETLNRRIDRRYTAIFISLLLIPLCICAFCDLIADGRLSWSAYVLGGLGLVFVWFLLPAFFKRRRAIKCVLLDGLAAAGMLRIVEFMTGGAWFWTLGLPLTLISMLFASMLVGLFSKKCRLSPLVRAGLGAIGAGLYTVLIEGALMLHAGALYPPRWSGYSFIPCLVLGVALMLLDRRADAKEQLRRRFFI